MEETMKNYFTKKEKCLWSGSVALIFVSFLCFDRENGVTLAASVIGVTSLVFNAKGNPVGQVLMVIFSCLYGFISWQCDYYGEMITYLGMTAPMAVVALVSWLRHPYEGNRAQVQVNRLNGKEVLFLVVLTTLITWGFYYILAFFHTANLLFSTISVTTSFLAVYLTFRRSPWYAVGYAANDVVLMVLWALAAHGKAAGGVIIWAISLYFFTILCYTETGFQRLIIKSN